MFKYFLCSLCFVNKTSQCHSTDFLSLIVKKFSTRISTPIVKLDYASGIMEAPLLRYLAVILFASPAETETIQTSCLEKKNPVPD